MDESLDIVEPELVVLLELLVPDVLGMVLPELGDDVVDDEVDGGDVVDEVDVEESSVEPLGAAWVAGEPIVDDDDVPVCEPVVGETPGPAGAVPLGGLVVCGPPVLALLVLLPLVPVLLWPIATPAAASEAMTPRVAARFKSLLMSMLQ